MAAGRITTMSTMYKYTRCACNKVGPRQCFRYMAAIPEALRMESTEKREYELKLVHWRNDMSALRKKFLDDYQKLMQSKLSSQEDNIEEERQRENKIEEMLQERNREYAERRYIARFHDGFLNCGYTSYNLYVISNESVR